MNLLSCPYDDKKRTKVAEFVASFPFFLRYYEEKWDNFEVSQLYTKERKNFLNKKTSFF